MLSLVLLAWRLQSLGAVINFEGFPDKTVIRNQYLESYMVRLDGIIIQPTQGSSSGQYALEARSTDNEFHHGPLIILFEPPGQSSVKLRVGVNRPGSANVTAEIVAYDASGTQVAGPVTAPLGSTPTPVSTLLAVSSAQSNIRKVTVRCHNAVSDSLFEVIDDVEFDQVVPAVTDQIAPVVTITSPLNNSKVSTPFFPLNGAISEATDLTNVRLRISPPSGNATEYDIEFYGAAPQFSFGNLTLMGELEEGVNTITVEATDIGHNKGHASVIVTYEKPAPPPPVTLDLRPAGIEVSQGVNRVYAAPLGGGSLYCCPGQPLAANKRTIVRVYGRVSGASLPVQNVTCELRGWRVGELPESPLQASSTITIDPAQDLTHQRRSLNLSWNFVLPPSWITAGMIRLSAFINHSQPVLECPTCYNLDNQFDLLDVSFKETLPLIISPIEVCVRRSENSTGCDSPAPNVATTVFTAVNSMFPLVYPVADGNVLINLLPNRFMTFDGDFNRPDGAITKGRMSALCSEISSRVDQDTDGNGLPANEVYVAIIPIPVTDWPGLATLSYGSAVVKVDPASFWGDGGTAAEEVGHTMGRYHAPCGNSGYQDSGYPYYPNPAGGLYPRGSIGEWGLETRGAMSLYDPAINYDLMSYCAKWVSPYTIWNAYYRLQVNPAPARPPLRDPKVLSYVLLVTGRIDALGQVTLNPFHVFQRSTDAREPGGEYMLELLNVDDRSLLSWRFQPAPIMDAEQPTWYIHELLPFPVDTTQIVLSHEGRVLQRRAVSRGAPQVTVLAPNGGEEWIGPGPYSVNWQAWDPDADLVWATVQYSKDNGLSWSTLAANLTNSQFEVDPGRLPGATQARIRVRVSDGVHTASDASDGPFFVPFKPPVLGVISPESGAVFYEDQYVPLEVMATDLQDGPLGNTNVWWRSDHNGPLGQGRHLDVNHLSPGLHNITATAYDQGGRSAEQNVEVQILPRDLQISILTLEARNQCRGPVSHTLTLAWRSQHLQALAYQVGPLVVTIPGETNLVLQGPFPDHGTMTIPILSPSGGEAQVLLYVRDQNNLSRYARQGVLLPECTSYDRTEASVDLGFTDLEAGLQNSQRQDGGDGENTPDFCGLSERSSRRNLGDLDPTPDVADFYMYFNVTDRVVKQSSHLIVSAVVYDDSSHAGDFIGLHYTSATNSPNPTNMITIHPMVHTLSGEGNWRTLSWEIRDARFRSLMEGGWDFRLMLPRPTCVDRVNVQSLSSFSPAPGAILAIERRGQLLMLSWTDLGYTLQSAWDVGGPWTNVADATNPYLLTDSLSQRFFRLVSR